MPNVPTEKYSITITGLENGQPCDVRVRAVNAKTSSTGPWRWVSATATPVQVPGPPGLDTTGVLSAHEALQVIWTPPADTGGGVVTGYEITYSSGRNTPTNQRNRLSHFNNYHRTQQRLRLHRVGQSHICLGQESTLTCSNRNTKGCARRPTQRRRPARRQQLTPAATQS